MSTDCVMQPVLFCCDGVLVGNALRGVSLARATTGRPIHANAQKMHKLSSASP